jgi:TPR repeat protein
MKKIMMFCLLLVGFNAGYAQEFVKMAELAKQGIPLAQYNLGIMCYSGEDTPIDTAKAFYWFEKAATQGDTTIVYNVGYIYNRIIGDWYKKKAVYWYEKAMNLGSISATYNLSLIYAIDEGAFRDERKAFILAEKAANLGHLKAQYLLGKMYDSGLGVLKDTKKAVYWYEKVALLGNIRLFTGTKRQQIKEMQMRNTI